MSFLKNMELDWEARNTRLRKQAGMINPEFQGGTINDFTHWVNAKIAYSAVSRMSEGVWTVIVEFVVARDGSVKEGAAVFGSYPELNDEAVRIVKKSPKWKPAELAGEKKNVRLSVPVVFEF